MKKFTGWSLMSKIMFVGIGAIFTLSSILFILYGFEDRTKTLDSYVNKARTICLLTESVRNEMEKKWALGIMSPKLMRAFADRGENEKVISMVPVVSAWQAAYERAEEMGYQFKVPKFSPRNPKNEPDKIEAEALNTMKKENISDYTFLDREKNTIRVFRAVRLSEICMLCHGDPATSVELWGNSEGVDPTGSRMESWKTGEIHGAFEIIQSLDALDRGLERNIMKGSIIVLAGIVLAALTFWILINRSVANPIRLIVEGLNIGAGEVSEASLQVAEDSQKLADGATNQAASLEETASSLEEISSMARNTAENAKETNSLTHATSKVVERANSSMEKLIGSMSEITEASDKTSQIIRTIDEIAFQTNLLALNAAVEAARAGEAGAGFAVVADEVRNLAMRAAEAAKTTTSMIEASSEKIEHGVQIVNDTSSAFSEVAAAVEKIQNLVAEIADASNETSLGVTHINQAISKIDQVVQDTAAISEESAAAAEEMSGQAKEMKSFVEDLMVIVNGSGSEVNKYIKED